MRAARFAAGLELTDKMQKTVLTEVENGTLYIKKDNRNDKDENVAIYLSAPTLESIFLNDGCDFSSEKIVSKSPFILHAKDGCDIKIDDLNSESSLTINLEDGADLKIDALMSKGALSLTADDGCDIVMQKIMVQGVSEFIFKDGSDCSIKKFNAKDCRLKLEDSCDAIIELEIAGNLTVNADDSCDVNLSGKVKNLQLTCTDSSNANISNLKYDKISIKIDNESEIIKPL